MGYGISNGSMGIPRKDHKYSWDSCVVVCFSVTKTQKGYRGPKMAQMVQKWTKFTNIGHWVKGGPRG